MISTAFNIQQVKSTRSLTSELIESLRGNILKDNLAPGTKLPSAGEIEKQSGVSRSVVREAVAALKAEGLIVSRQGVGMFVGNSKKVQLLRFEIDESEFSSIEGVTQLLELRMAAELEMTSMAAKNRTTKQMLHIWHCLAQFDNQVAEGKDAAKEELNYHLAIADASANPYFSRFIKFICEGVNDTQAVMSNDEKSAESLKYLVNIQKERKKIAQAIEAQDPELARYAMLEHLTGISKQHLKRAQSYINH